MQETGTPQTPLKQSSQLPETPHKPTHSLTTNTSSGVNLREVSKLDAKAPTFVPATMLVQSTNYIDSQRSHSGVGNPNDTDSSASSQHEGDSIDDEPTIRYVHLKLKYEHILANRARHPQTRLEEIRSQISELKMDILFDEHEAAELYQNERDKVLFAKLRGSEPSQLPVNQPPRVPERIQAPSPPLPSSPSPDIFDDAGSVDSGEGLLGLLEAPPAETSSDGITIALKDMASPRNWAGRTLPKILLKEAVARLDRYAIITYNLISGSSRAKRVSLMIRWDGKKSDSWSMDTVACVDQTQAEHYISLTALHAITFPQSEGFASSASRASNPTFFRLLPPKFRDLWDELEEAKKSREDSTNRQVWAKLRSIVEPKLDLDRRVRTSSRRRHKLMVRNLRSLGK